MYVRMYGYKSIQVSKIVDGDKLSLAQLRTTIISMYGGVSLPVYLLPSLRSCMRAVMRLVTSSRTPVRHKGPASQHI